MVRLWDPDSLSSFWFELVKWSLRDIFQRKAHVNLLTARFLFNWIVSQEGSQFYPFAGGWNNHMDCPTRLSPWYRCKGSNFS